MARNERSVIVSCPHCGNKTGVLVDDIFSTEKLCECKAATMPNTGCGRKFFVHIRLVPEITTYTLEHWSTVSNQS